MAADRSAIPHAKKVIRFKPAWVKDTCWESPGVAHEERFTKDPSATTHVAFDATQRDRMKTIFPHDVSLDEATDRRHDDRDHHHGRDWHHHGGD